MITKKNTKFNFQKIISLFWSRKNRWNCWTKLTHYPPPLTGQQSNETGNY